MLKSVRFIQELIELDVKFRVLHERKLTLIKVYDRSGRSITHQLQFLRNDLTKVNGVDYEPGTSVLSLLQEMGFYGNVGLPKDPDPIEEMPVNFEIIPGKAEPKPKAKRKMRRI